MTPASPVRAIGLMVVLALAGCSPAGEGAANPSNFVEIPGIGSTRVDVPRPTGSEGAACSEEPPPAVADDTIVDRVAALRSLGLFADRAGMTDAALAAAVETAMADVWGAPEDVLASLIELVVAEQDPTRVWWRDLEADVAQKNEVYAQTVAEWAEISAGAFEPSDIVETWQGPDGPVIIGFTLDGTARTLSPEYLEDWIDPRILAPINEAIAGSGRRFELVKAFDQTAFVIALTEDERTGFEARGWCFE
jgi:hypothetical protein